MSRVEVIYLNGEPDSGTMERTEEFFKLTGKKPVDEQPGNYWQGERDTDEKLALLIKDGVCIDAYDRDGDNLLHKALYGSFNLAVQLLLDKGADVNKLGSGSDSPIYTAVKKHNLLAAKMLIEKGVNLKTNGKNPFVAAFKYHGWDIMKLLIENGADVGNSGWNQMYTAAMRDDVEEIKRLLAAGESVQSNEICVDNWLPPEFTIKNPPALEIAIRYDSAAAMEVLLDNGGTVAGENQSVMLHMAAERDCVNVMQALIGRGMDIESRRGATESTPLHTAVKNKSLKSIERLLINGADIEARDGANRTPLQACFDYMGGPKFPPLSPAAKLLMSLGANIHVCDESGYGIIENYYDFKDRDWKEYEKFCRDDYREPYKLFRMSGKPPGSVEEVYKLLAAIPLEDGKMAVNRQGNLLKIFMHAKWESREQAEALLREFVEHKFSGFRSWVVESVMEKVVVVKGWTGRSKGGSAGRMV